jgi:rare lipoprotein A (peptidoglycan hydrolase)
MALTTIGCDTKPTEILVASKPSQASVTLDQAELGVTPVKIQIIEDTKIVISKPGYEPYATVLSPSEDPNQIFTLEKKEMSQVNSLTTSPPTEAQLTSIENTEQFQGDQPTYLKNPIDQKAQIGEPKKILIASKPSEATVRLNQENLGVTPLEVIMVKDSALEVSKPGYQSYVNILSYADEPNLIVTLEKNQSASKTTRPRPTVARKKPRLNISDVKQMYRQGRINKLKYSARVRELEYQMKSDLLDLKMLYKRGGINKYDYGRRVNEIKYRYKG